VYNTLLVYISYRKVVVYSIHKRTQWPWWGLCHGPPQWWRPV